MRVDALFEARCHVAEPDGRRAQGALAERGGAADDAPTGGVVTLRADRTAVVTNTFPSSVLPSTAGDVLRLVDIAVGSIAAGALVALTAAFRRRCTPTSRIRSVSSWGWRRPDVDRRRG